MADGFETIGWVLKVENKATSQVDKIVSHLEKQVADVAYQVGDFGKQFYALGEKQGKVGKGLANAAGLITTSFGRVFGSLRVEMQELFINTFSDVTKKGIYAASGLFIKGITGYVKGINKVKTAWTDFTTFMTTERTWGEILDTGTKSAKKLSLGILSLAKSSLGYAKSLGGPTIAAGWMKVTTALRSGTQNIGAFFQKVLSIKKIGDAFRSVGGIVGMILGPFGKILDLFSPLIDMIVDEFTPAMETFSDIIKSAFGPLGMTFEILARNLATAIVPFIKPLASFVELAAVQIGTMVQELLKGDLGGLMADLVGMFNQMRPVAMHLITVLMDAGKKIGGALLRALTKVGPALLKLVAGLLEAIIPLVPPLTNIAVTLLEKVLVPALLGIAGWLDRWMPTITEFIDAFAIGIGKIAVKVDDFFSNIGKYADQFKALFIDPITSWLSDLWTTVVGYVMELPGKVSNLLSIVGRLANALLAKPRARRHRREGERRLPDHGRDDDVAARDHA